MRMSAMSAAEQRVERGCLLLGAGRTVVTDRLHGVLLALHLGRRVIAVDNNYGKLSSYLDTWLTDGAPLSRVDDWQQACQIELA
jgi:pyruvyl transferase EpsO